MKKEQLLQFINKEHEKYMSTHRIALKAKINDYVALALLTELANLPRPLVKKVEFGKRRMHRLWKQTKLEKNQVEAFLKIPPENRDTKEHLVILRDRWWGNFGEYIKDIIKEVEKRYEKVK